ncbi:hypothetical protein B0H63DRAFT_506905 [Podospora didyma]|uniref:Uncharacterized protein n=1 Tax=Podospora didyma TaxID=330526 RepID=A0AAE0NX38_9PEZI|nr:hypothetical protein B0H63DRAFT_506905 [Podospora didyma]
MAWWEEYIKLYGGTDANRTPEVAIAATDADLTLLVGLRSTKKVEKKFKVCSAMMRAASPIGKAAIADKRPEECKWVIRFPYEDFEFVLRLVHNQFVTIPKQPEPSIMCGVLIVLRKYDMERIICPWTTDWMNFINTSTLSLDTINGKSEVKRGIYQLHVVEFLRGEALLSAVIQRSARKSTRDHAKQFAFVQEEIEKDLSWPVIFSLGYGACASHKVDSSNPRKFHKELEEIHHNTAGPRKDGYNHYRDLIRGSVANNLSLSGQSCPPRNANMVFQSPSDLLGSIQAAFEVKYEFEPKLHTSGSCLIKARLQSTFLAFERELFEETLLEFELERKGEDEETTRAVWNRRSEVAQAQA